MIVKTSIKGNNILCDCCNKEFSDTTMKHYEIGAFKNFTLCKECEKQLFNIPFFFFYCSSNIFYIIVYW